MFEFTYGEISTLVERETRMGDTTEVTAPTVGFGDVGMQIPLVGSGTSFWLLCMIPSLTAAGQASNQAASKTAP